MRKDIAIEKILIGGEKLNKSALARQYGCCWRTIDKNIIDEKIEKYGVCNTIIIRTIADKEATILLQNVFPTL